MNNKMLLLSFLCSFSVAEDSMEDIILSIIYLKHMDKKIIIAMQQYQLLGSLDSMINCFIIAAYKLYFPQNVQ